MSTEINNLRGFGKFRLDVEKRVLWFENEPVNLQLKEIELLCVLTENGQEVVTKEELLDRVWADSFVEESNLSRHIYQIRRVFRDLGEADDMIQTVPRRGYRFAAEVREIEHGEFIIEKHTRTQTLIEIQDENNEGKTKVSANPVVVVALTVLLAGLTATAAFVIYKRSAANTSFAGMTSIAVLPLQTASAAEEDKTIAFGIVESLAVRLGGLKQLVVRQIPHESNRAENANDPLKLGQQLGVDAVLAGSLQRAGGKVRLNLRLLDVNSGKQLWGGSYDEAESDIFSLEDAISAQVTNSLALNLSENERERISKHYTENVRAYESYLRGRYWYHLRNEDPEGYRKSLTEFENAIGLDPNYSLAYTGLADAYARRANVSTGAKRIELYEKAKTTAVKALALDDNLAEAHASLGWLRRIYDWNWQDSEKHLKKALELAPNNADHHRLYASLLITLGRTAEAVEVAGKARDLDPLSQGSTLAFALTNDRQYDEAIKEYAKALELNRNAADSRQGLILAYLGKGMYAEIIELVDQAPEDEKNNFKMRVYLATAHFHIGNVQKTLDILRDLELQKGSDPERAVRLAGIYGDMGRKDEAFDLLQTGLENRDDRLMWIKVASAYDSLRGEARFHEILRKMNLNH